MIILAMTSYACVPSVHTEYGTDPSMQSPRHLVNKGGLNAPPQPLELFKLQLPLQALTTTFRSLDKAIRYLYHI